MRFTILKPLFASNCKKTSLSRSQGRRFKATFEALEERRVLSVTWWVDPAATISYSQHVTNTIQDAVDHAATRDTIKVVPGVYHENVLVDNTDHDRTGITIIGGQKLHRGDLSGPSLVVHGIHTGFELDADCVGVKNFTIRPENENSGDKGIETDVNHSGYQIINNIILNEGTAGIILNSTTGSGTRATNVSCNQITNAGNAIYADTGLRNASITNNTILTSAFSSIVLKNTTKSCVSGNQVTSAGGLGLRLVDSGTSRSDGNTVSKNVMTDCNDIGINLENADYNCISGNNCSYSRENDGIGDDSSSDHNTFTRNICTFNHDDGIEIDGTCNTLTCNTTTNNGGAGIHILGANNTVCSNTADHNQGDGILLEDADNNTVTSNHAYFNSNDGIHVEGSSTGNSITRNKAKNNTNFDIQDESTGTNTWSNNTFGTRDPNTIS